MFDVLLSVGFIILAFEGWKGISFFPLSSATNTVFTDYFLAKVVFEFQNFSAFFPFYKELSFPACLLSLNCSST